jgi:hypothetical protein
MKMLDLEVSIDLSMVLQVFHVDILLLLLLLLLLLMFLLLTCCQILSICALISRHSVPEETKEIMGIKINDDLLCSHDIYFLLFQY